MPLSAAKPTLELDIKAAFEACRDAGVEDDSSDASNIAQLAADLANAIHNYTTQAIVSTTVFTGVVGACSVGPVAGAGSGAGNGTLA